MLKLLKLLQTPRSQHGIQRDSRLYVLRRDPLEELDVLLGVESRHVVRRRHVGAEHAEALVEAVVEHQAVGDGQAVRLHGVAGPVVEVAHLGVVEVHHAGVGHGHGGGGGGPQGLAGRQTGATWSRSTSAASGIYCF